MTMHIRRAFHAVTGLAAAAVWSLLFAIVDVEHIAESRSTAL